MHELDDDGALAQARGHAFDRAAAHVADYKNTGNACFEQTRITAEGPRGGFLAIANEVGAGENEAAAIALNDVAEPFGARQRAHEDEEARCGQLFGIARGRAENGDAGEATFPVDADDAGLRPDFDVGCFLDLLDQVVRHGAGKRIAAHEHNHFFSEFGEVHGRLAYGICSADDVNRFALAGNGFGGAAAVVNACALKLVTGNVESAPLNAGRVGPRNVTASTGWPGRSHRVVEGG